MVGRARVLRLSSVFVILLGVALASSYTPPAAGSEPAKPIEAVSTLPYPDIDLSNGLSGSVRVIGAHPDGHAVYTAVPVGGQMYLAEHRLRGATVEGFRRGAEPLPITAHYSPLTASFDVARNQLLIVGLDAVTTVGSVLVIDLETLATVRLIDLTTTLPGFAGMGMTYSPQDDRYYIAGEFNGSSAAVTLSKAADRPAGPIPAVVALDPTTGSVAWVRPLEQCPQLLESFSAGAVIGRAADRPVLYTVCTAGSLNGLVNYSQLAPGGVVRLSIDPDAGPTGAASFASDYFPISGSYRGATPGVTGMAVFDAVAERVFLQSLSPSTPGAWVFDGRRSAWVGFVAAPDNKDYYLGLNPSSGRYYLAGFDREVQEDLSQVGVGYINVTDGRATPIAQGNLVRFQTGAPGSFLATRPGTNQFVGLGADEGGVVTRPRLYIDHTDPIVPLEPVDYDALTQDLPDERSQVNFSSGVGGWGARWVLVGGWESALSSSAAVEGAASGSGLALGDRGLTLAGVPAVDLRAAGSSATAAIAAIDDATGSDLTDTDEQAGDQGALTFPYTVQTCLDGVGDDQHPSDDEAFGYVEATCDLQGLRSAATATFDDGASTGGLAVSRSSFDTTVTRDDERGTVTQTTATAEGISLGPVTIGKVTATTTTSANGRPDTAVVTYERHITDASTGEGGTALSCDQTYQAGSDPETNGDCEQLIAALNQALGARGELRLPDPQLTATPKGAYASLTETQDAYLNDLTVNNDADRALPALTLTVVDDANEKSRLVVQFAAIRANSILTRTPTFDAGPWPAPDDGAGTTTPTATPTPRSTAPTPPPPPPRPAATPPAPVLETTQPTTPPPAQAAPPPPTSSTEPTTVPSGWALRARDPAQAGLAAGLWALFALPGVALLRRRRLLGVLTDPVARSEQP